MTERIRVVFFHSATDTFSGGAKMLYRLLTGLDKDRFEPIVLTQAEDELARRLNEEGIRVEIVPPKGVLRKYDQRMLNLPLHRKATLGGRILQYNVDSYPVLRDADIVWCENTRSIVTLLPFGAISDTPIIWNVGLGQRPTGIMKYLQSFSFRVANQLFIESEEQAKRIFPDYYETNRTKFTVFKKGIDTDKFSVSKKNNTSFNTKMDSPAIGTAATLSPRKGLDDLIRAFQIVHDQNPEVNLYIAGDTSNEIHISYKAELNQLVNQFELEDSVHFLGWVDNMPNYLAELDIFVLTSYNEGISGAVREAMAMELPVVCSNVGGMSDLITHEETGLLVTPGDVNDISNSISHLLSDTGLQKELGKKGRDIVIHSHSLNSYLDDYEEFLINIAQPYD